MRISIKLENLIALEKRLQNLYHQMMICTQSIQLLIWKADFLKSLGVLKAKIDFPLLNVMMSVLVGSPDRLRPNGWGSVSWICTSKNILFSRRANRMFAVI